MILQLVTNKEMSIIQPESHSILACLLMQQIVTGLIIVGSLICCFAFHLVAAVNLVFCWMHAYEIEFHMFICLYSVKFHFRVTLSSALDCWLVSLGNGKTQGRREGAGVLF